MATEVFKALNQYFRVDKVFENVLYFNCLKLFKLFCFIHSLANTMENVRLQLKYIFFTIWGMSPDIQVLKF